MSTNCCKNARKVFFEYTFVVAESLHDSIAIDLVLNFMLLCIMKFFAMFSCVLSNYGVQTKFGQALERAVSLLEVCARNKCTCDDTFS